MAIEIRRTPVLEGEDAKRFTRLMFANRNKKVGLTPTPQLAELTAQVLKYQEKLRSGRGNK